MENIEIGIKISTLIYTIINFAILLLILKHFFWDKLKGIIESRQSEVEEIGREKEKAEYEVKKQAVDLAVELSIKALDTQIDEDLHRKLISDFIAKVGM